MDEDFLFAEDGTLKGGPTPLPEETPRPQGPPWLVLVVDDDEEVHSVTRYALRKVIFAGRPLELLAAYTAEQAERMLRQTPDIALVLLDVVMETDDAGLRLVRTIRDDMRNRAVRIVLRTGQPGQAPEERVIVDYDVNDYKAKTELTSQKLFTTVIAALRSYGDIMALEANRRGLRQLINAGDRLSDHLSLPEFAHNVLGQVDCLLDVATNSLVCRSRAGRFHLLAATGEGEAMLDQPVVQAEMNAALGLRQSVFEEKSASLFVPVTGGEDLVAWVGTPRPLTSIDRDLLEVLAAKLSGSCSNLVLYERLRQANADLRDLAQGLESRVAERTQELVEANSKLERLASIDSLTGILNRRRFMEMAAQEWERSTRYGRRFSVLLLDLDHFKQVNDTYGHAAGDAAIRMAANWAAAALRGTDAVARYGGEELVVLLPESDLASAHMVAERIRRMISLDPVEHEGLRIPISASLGVAEWLGPEESLDALLNRADQALYQAKQLGRNRVVSTPPAAAVLETAVR